VGRGKHPKFEPSYLTLVIFLNKKMEGCAGDIHGDSSNLYREFISYLLIRFILVSKFRLEIKKRLTVERY